jgi:hypothetical protein
MNDNNSGSNAMRVIANFQPAIESHKRLNGRTGNYGNRNYGDTMQNVYRDPRSFDNRLAAFDFRIYHYAPKNLPEIRSLFLIQDTLPGTVRVTFIILYENLSQKP